MTGTRWLPLALLTLALMAGAAFLLQRQQGETLRAELALRRDEQAAVARLRLENARLKAAQPPAADLERLRADRAALARLRSEIDGLTARAEAKANRLATPDAEGKPSGAKPPALRLALSVAPGGALAADGAAIDAAHLRARFAAVPRGGQVEVRLRILDAKMRAADLKQAHHGLIDLAKEFGLLLNVHFEPGADGGRPQ